jgi:hypothetical protein
MITIDWIAMKDVRVLHEYVPENKTMKKRLKLYSAHKPHIELYQTPNGELLLKSGIDAYNTFAAASPTNQIPVFIINRDITKLDWTFKLLHSCFNENVYFLIKYEYIMILLDKTNNNIEKICTKVGCSEDEIEKYIIDQRVPDMYKELAIYHKRHVLVNMICREPTIEGYRSLLYKAAFNDKNRLTQEKLKTFIKYIGEGYSINVNSLHAQSQLNKIVDRDQAYKNHWIFLWTYDPTFNNNWVTLIQRPHRPNKNVSPDK